MVFFLAVLLCAAAATAKSATPALHLSPAELQFSGDNVTVSWTPGLAGDGNSTEYFLALYAPPTSSDADIISVFPVDAASGTSGPLPVARVFGAEAQFRLWRGDPRAAKHHKQKVRSLKGDKKRLRKKVVLVKDDPPATLIAVSPALPFSPAPPAELHVSRYLSTSPQIVILWTSIDAAPGSVEFWTSAPNAQSAPPGTVVPSVVSTYAAKDMCGGPAAAEGFRWPGNLHRAVVDPGAFGGRIFYTFGSNETTPDGGPGSPGGRSALMSIRGVPAPGAAAPPMIVYGDQGVSDHFGLRGLAKTYPSAEQTALHLSSIAARGDASVILLIGDVSYARGYAWQWPQWHAEMRDPLASMFLLPAVGNHEFDWPGIGFRPSWGNYGSDSGGECGVPYSARFWWPGSGDGTIRRPMYYEFLHGLVHNIVLSSETDFTPGSSQYTWFVDRLQAVNRTLTPHLIVSQHRPIVTSFNTIDAQGVVNKMASVLGPLLAKFNVDIFFAGHVHSYERTSPVSVGATAAPVHNARLRDTPTPAPVAAPIGNGGTVHILTGGAGNDYQVGITFPRPSWSEFSTYRYGFVRLAADTADSLFVEYIADDDGTAIDSAWIKGGPGDVGVEALDFVDE